MAKLEARHLTISFRTNNGAVRAVRDISFSLNAGETLAIAGESGSGKSVTARAIMGILAGNAMVENGEIIYDGMDLLKIPEEDFHTLRGYKLAMVFQDPLSALNPIMRIGQQLTEAMILNNKERRRDGKKRYNMLLQLLQENMKKAGVANAEEQIAAFRAIVQQGMDLTERYQTARESAVEAWDRVEETRMRIRRKEEKAVRETLSRMVKANRRVFNEFVIPEGSAEFTAVAGDIGRYAKSYQIGQEEELTAVLDRAEAILKPVAEPTEQPDFVAIAYARAHGSQLSGGNVAELNATARKILSDGFMDKFLQDTAKACEAADKASRAEMANAAKVLQQERPVFERDVLDRKESYAAGKRAAEAVERTINRMAVEKDSASWVFSSSVRANLNRYFYGVKTNPKEQRRFQRDTQRHDQLEAKGKEALSVIPLNLVNLDTAKGNIVTAMNELAARFTAAGSVEKDYSREASVLVDKLVEYASQYAHKISKALAKHHAIELMEEVGIPEPYRRFSQYPFEFSGGMRQRIVIAIALSANPDILICDEPTTALDVTIQAQILELINRLKVQRQLSVIFITHDLGVVANMADRLAVMYAGKIVEYGTADDVFYDPRHPYTWALLSSMPDLETKEKLEAIPGTPPDMILPPKGDAFAARNKYAMAIDFEEQPPMFHVSDTHWAATWLLHPNAPHVDPPKIVTERIERMQRLEREKAEKGGVSLAKN